MIYGICAWNFAHFGGSRNDYDSVKKTHGNWKPDNVQIQLWIVHSIGKKVIKLMNTDGVMKKSAVYSQWFNENYYHKSLEEAETMTKKLHADDENETKQPLVITFNQVPTRY